MGKLLFLISFDTRQLSISPLYSPCTSGGKIRYASFFFLSADQLSVNHLRLFFNVRFIPSNLLPLVLPTPEVSLFRFVIWFDLFFEQVSF